MKDFYDFSASDTPRIVGTELDICRLAVRLWGRWWWGVTARLQRTCSGSCSGSCSGTCSGTCASGNQLHNRQHFQ